MSNTWARLIAQGVVLASVMGTMPAEAAAFAGGLKAGTLGLGGEIAVGLNNYLGVRASFNSFDYSDTREEDGIEYDGKLELKSFGAQLDLHPFKGNFYLTGGFFSNGNKLRLHASDPTGTEVYDIGDAEYRSDTSDPLNIKGALDFKSTVPYLGLGWGHAPVGESSLYFRFELGAYFQGAGKLALDASGSAVDENGDSFDVDGSSPEAQLFQANLEQERAETESDIGEFKIWPAIEFAIGYRF